MKKCWIVTLVLLIIICPLTGCWNYREVEQLAIVSGAAIDKDGEDNVFVTTEIVSVDEAQQQSVLKPVYIQMAGKTFFDAIRSMVAIQGKRLYWSHAKILIISEAIAKDGITDVMDFINRDAEVREDMWVLISREKSAREIFNSKPIFERIVGFEIDDTMRAQKSISRYPAVELYEFLDNIGSEETSTTIPTVKLINVRGITATYVTGAAIIKNNKLAGYLNEDETKTMLWLQDEIKGGIYPVKNAAGSKTDVSLEIFRNKTKVKPEIKGNSLIINIKAVTDVNIAEIMGNKDFITGQARDTLERAAEAQLKKDMESLIEKAQKEYKTDFLGFGETVKRSIPGVWKSIEKDWGGIFTDLETNIDVDFKIRGSATTIKPMKVGK